MDKKRPIWSVLSSDVVYSCKPYIEVSREKVQLPDGTIVPDYHRLTTGQFANILPVFGNGDFMLIHQYRHGIRSWALTVPGGKIEQGESPRQAAVRELREETGYEAEVFERIGTYAASCTYGFANNHYFIARDLTEVVAPNSGDLEDAEIVRMSAHDAVEASLEGKFAAGGHVLALSLYVMKHLMRGA